MSCLLVQNGGAVPGKCCGVDLIAPPLHAVHSTALNTGAAFATECAEHGMPALQVLEPGTGASQ